MNRGLRRRSQDADARDFLDGELDDLIVRLVPQRIGVVAEILEADPHLDGIGDQVRAPVIEDLHAADEHVGLLDIDPRVLDPRSVRLRDEQAIHQQSHGDEVAIHQAVGDRRTSSGTGASMARSSSRTGIVEKK